MESWAAKLPVVLFIRVTLAVVKLPGFCPSQQHLWPQFNQLATAAGAALKHRSRAMGYPSGDYLQDAAGFDQELSYAAADRRPVTNVWPYSQRALKDRISSISLSLQSEVTSPTPLLLLAPLLPGQEHQTCLGDAHFRLMVSSGLYISSCFRWWIFSVFTLMVSESSKATEVRIRAD